MLAVWVEQLLSFATGALAAIRKDEHYPALMAWARAEGTALLGGNMALAQALAPELWSQTPLERLDFACEPLARPGPNEPCWCDSGHKTKQCCGAVKLPGAIPEHLMWMLSLRDWKGPTLKAALASHQAPAQALLEAGLISAEGSQRGRAQQLLEALFAQSDWAQLPEQADPAFELLIDLYQERGFNRKRDALLEAVFEHGTLELRGSALERLCLMHLDNDDLASAREAFVHAQQTLPDSPTLAYIEAMLLLHEGHIREASERARFWFRRLSRRGELDLEQLEFLAELADNPSATLAEQMLNAEEELAEPLVALQALLEVLEGAPRLELQKNVEGGLEYNASNQEDALFTAFQQHFQATVDEDSPLSFRDEPWANAEDWLVELCANPEWLDSPQVVQSLILALTLRFGSLPWMAPSLFEPLAYRLEGWLAQIEALRDENRLDENRLDEKGQGGELLWDVADNAVLLRTGLALVVGMERGAREHSRALAERLLALDEQDSLGLLELVLDQLLRDGRDARALEISETSAQPPLLGTLMGKALALYRLERAGEAARVVKEASSLNSHVIHLLCDSRSGRGIKTMKAGQGDAEPAPGSREEAWQYRTLMRDQWIATPGALEWLDQQA